jgi:hypothetical protein
VKFPAVRRLTEINDLSPRDWIKIDSRNNVKVHKHDCSCPWRLWASTFVGITLGISFEAPKFGGLRHLHPLVRPLAPHLGFAGVAPHTSVGTSAMDWENVHRGPSKVLDRVLPLAEGHVRRRLQDARTTLLGVLNMYGHVLAHLVGARRPKLGSLAANMIAPPPISSCAWVTLPPGAPARRRSLKPKVSHSQSIALPTSS